MAHSIVTLSTSGAGGTATLTASGNLTLGPRATLQISSTTLGAATKFFVIGTLPTADATGILPRITSTTDFLTYNGATGLTPFTGYATDFTTPGTNVAVTAAASVPSSDQHQRYQEHWHVHHDDRCRADARRYLGNDPEYVRHAHLYRRHNGVRL